MNVSQWLLASGWHSEEFGDANAGRYGQWLTVDEDLISRMAGDVDLDSEALHTFRRGEYSDVIAYVNEYGQTWYIGCKTYVQADSEWRNFVEDWEDEIILYERAMNG